MKKFKVNFGDYTLAFENADCVPFLKNKNSDEYREVKSMKDIMYFYNNIIIYDNCHNKPIFKTSSPDESIVEYLSEFIDMVINSTKEDSQYKILENDGFIKKSWIKTFSIEGIGYSPKFTIIKTINSVKQKHENRFKNNVYYSIIISDGLSGEGKAFMFDNVDKYKMIEIGKQANLFIEDFINNYNNKNDR